MNRKILSFVISAVIVVTGCTTSLSDTPKNEEMKTPVQVEDIQKTESQKTEDKNMDIDQQIDLQKVKPNEAGQIMVLMYHSINEPEAEFTRTPDNFRRDLQYLYDHGYRPLSLTDYVMGNVTTQQGYTPIVLTFDDGWQNNFNMIQNEKGDWVVDPDSGVGILEKFHQDHPDFPLEATFFINDNIAFGQKEFLSHKLQYIVQMGMDIGNHTATHVNFSNVDSSRIQQELAKIVELVGGHVKDYEVNTLALPFGSRPKNKELYKYLHQGEQDGVAYKNVAILEVGWDPYKSPYHKDFNPLAIHRVRASDMQKYVQGVGMYDWLTQFDKGNRVRYISDGDPDTVTVPENYGDVLDPQKIGNRTIRTYILEK